MSNEVAVYDGGHGGDIAINRAPDVVLAEATRAAKALSTIIEQKKNVVRFGGKTYIQYEDWQTVGRFYGITAKPLPSEYVEYGDAKGFVTRAIAVRADGVELSAAEAMCMSDEPNWRGKPLNYLRSMSQTRACAKALRNVLAWVVVLAGYEPTPAEEMDGETHEAPVPTPRAKEPDAVMDPEPGHPSPGGLISEAQIALIIKMYKADKYGMPILQFATKTCGREIKDLAFLSKAEASNIITALKGGK